MTGKDLKTLREIMGMDQTEFGKYWGYHHPQQRISELENGRRVIPRRIVEFASDIQTGKIQLEDFLEQKNNGNQFNPKIHS